MNPSDESLDRLSLSRRGRLSVLLSHRSLGSCGYRPPPWRSVNVDIILGEAFDGQSWATSSIKRWWPVCSDSVHPAKVRKREKKNVISCVVCSYLRPNMLRPVDTTMREHAGSYKYNFKLPPI